MSCVCGTRSLSQFFLVEQKKLNFYLKNNSSVVKIFVSFGHCLTLGSLCISSFQCTQCSKCFGNKKCLRQHMLIHGDKRPHACTYCGQKFRELYRFVFVS